MGPDDSLKTTISPDISPDRDTDVPAFACPVVVRGIWTPFWLYTQKTSPEQSKPLCGVLPPDRYGLPICVVAVYATPYPEYVLSGTPVATLLCEQPADKIRAREKIRTTLNPNAELVYSLACCIYVFVHEYNSIDETARDVIIYFSLTGGGVKLYGTTNGNVLRQRNCVG